MSKSSLRKTTRQANLRLVIEEVGGVTALAALLGTPKSHVSAMQSGARGVGDDLAARIERATDKPSGWMDQPHWMSVQHPSEGMIVHPVAQDLSQHLSMIEPTKISWESIMSAVLPALFRVVMPDDAMSPEYPKGLEVICSITNAPNVGSLVLVSDAHGVLHAREYRQGRSPGQWIAAPSNRSYATFDSDGDSLRVVAVGAYKGLP